MSKKPLTIGVVNTQIRKAEAIIATLRKERDELGLQIARKQRRIRHDATTDAIDVLRKERDLVCVQLDQAISRKEGWKLKLNNLGSSVGVAKVTDHAVVRYLERHLGFDIEQIRNEILTNSAIGKTIRDGKVVTVMSTVAEGEAIEK